MTAKDYPITFPYGATSPPYSATHPHSGEDRKMPVGTPVEVSGVVIGLSGNTGQSTGAHLHVQKRINDIITHPLGSGFDVVGTVVETGENDEIGKFVRIQAGSQKWSYFHLSEIRVNEGDIIKKKEETVMFNEGNVRYWFTYFVGREANANDIEFAKRYMNGQNGGLVAYLDQGIVHHPGFVPAFQREDRIKELEQQLKDAQNGFELVPEQLFKKKG